MKKIKSNITAIIPVHEYNDDIQNYLIESVKSLKNQGDVYEFDDIFIVAYGEDITAQIQKVIGDISIITNTDNPSYQNQVMLGAKNVKSKYFTIIEFDDEVSSKYLQNMVKYINKYDEADIYLSTMVEVNEENKRIKDTNIQAWSKQLVGDDKDVGFLHEDLLMEYTDFKLSGAVIDIDKFIEIKGFKEKIVFSFGFEFLLRALKNNLKIFIVPKMLYKHLTDREGSITKHFLSILTKKDVKFWFEAAVSESEYSNDRDIDLSPLNEDEDSNENLLTVKK